MLKNKIDALIIDNSGYQNFFFKKKFYKKKNNIKSGKAISEKSVLPKVYSKQRYAAGMYLYDNDLIS